MGSGRIDKTVVRKGQGSSWLRRRKHEDDQWEGAGVDMLSIVKDVRESRAKEKVRVVVSGKALRR